MTKVAARDFDAFWRVASGSGPTVHLARGGDVFGRVICGYHRDHGGEVIVCMRAPGEPLPGSSWPICQDCAAAVTSW